MATAAVLMIQTWIVSLPRYWWRSNTSGMSSANGAVRMSNDPDPGRFTSRVTRAWLSTVHPELVTTLYWAGFSIQMFFLPN